MGELLNVHRPASAAVGFVDRNNVVVVGAVPSKAGLFVGAPNAGVHAS